MSRRLRGTLLVATLVSACVIPTEGGDRLTLEIMDPPTELLVGETVGLEVVVSGAGGTIENAVVRFESSADTVILVDAESGEMLAVGEGESTITARLAQYDVPPVSVSLFVTRGVLVAGTTVEESPDGKARYGEVLRIRGRHLNPDSLASITFGPRPMEIVSYDPGTPGDPASYEQLRVVVPRVTRTSAIPVRRRVEDLLIVHTSAGTGSRSVEIAHEDVLELGAQPRTFTVDASGFRAVELTMPGYPDHDQYRFELPAGDWTIETTLRDGVSFSPGNPFWFGIREPGDVMEGRPVWGREARGFNCVMRGFPPGTRNTPFSRGFQPFTLPLRLDESRTIDFVVFGEIEAFVGYDLTVQPGYRSELLPDPAEGNDFCDGSHPVPIDGAGQLFNFDNPSDHDWYEVVVPGDAPSYALSSRLESEDNDTRERAEEVESGNRIRGFVGDAGDVDYFAIQLVAGTLLDVEVAGWIQQPDRPPGGFGGSVMDPDLSLFDSDGTLIVRTGSSSEVPDGDHLPDDAHLRWVVPEDGRYYLALTGTSTFSGDDDFGDQMFYSMDVRALPWAGTVTIDVDPLTGGMDPDLIVLERRSGFNAYLARRLEEGPAVSYSFPVAPGPHAVLLYNADARSGEYELRVTFVPSPAAAAGGGGP